MPNWDRYCTVCGQDGSYLDFEPPYGMPGTQRCSRYPEDGCGTTVVWLEDDGDRLRTDASKVTPYATPARKARRMQVS